MEVLKVESPKSNKLFVLEIKNILAPEQTSNDLLFLSYRGYSSPDRTEKIIFP